MEPVADDRIEIKYDLSDIDKNYEKINRKYKIIFRMSAISISILAIPAITLFCMALALIVPLAGLYAGFTVQPEEIKRRDKDGT